MAAPKAIAPQPFRRLIRLLPLALLLSLGLTGCGRDDKPKATQVAAKVNGEEISVHQLNALLAKTPTTPDAAEKVRAEVLEKLIDQQLVYEQARSKKLDRNADVVMAVEMAKREIIARAHLEQLVSTLPALAEQEIKTYYTSNPALFAERRLYRIEELSLDPQPNLLEGLKAQVEAGKTIDDIAAWLQTQGVIGRKGAATRAAEQIGMELLPSIAALKDGENVLILGGKNYLILRLLESKSEPITEEQAKPRIAQFLQTQRVQKLINEETQRLRAAAQVDYLGDFAKTPATPADQSAAK
jgi:EpsD family peptidyl-prolyl cis-trans isomerase